MTVPPPGPIAPPPPTVVLEPETIQFESCPLRGVFWADTTLLIGADLCRAVDAGTKPSSVLAALDPDMKVICKVRTRGGPQQLTCVTEAGAYAIALQGRKPAAQRLRYWLCTEVLPQISRTGRYISTAGSSPHDPLLERLETLRNQSLALLASIRADRQASAKKTEQLDRRVEHADQ